MAQAISKITLSSSRDIPFNKLVLSQANVRRFKDSVSIEELAADIARRGLLQGLNVRPQRDADGAETGLYEIPAGGRRYQALALLVKQKRLPKTAPIPCVVREAATDILAEDDSLAENIQRAPLHPLDQFRAFQAMREKGMAEADIAAAFFVSAHVVKQRLHLASVSPRLLDLYGENGMTLEQLMAFTVNPDHARQEQVWEAVSNAWVKEPFQIRRLLTERSVRASDRRARFVGLEAYEEAGGTVLRDLFQQDDDGWLEDVGLIDRLVTEKLKAAADTIAAEGWRWTEAAVEFPYGHAFHLRRIDGAATDLSADERQSVEALRAEQARLEAEHAGGDELPEAVDERLGEIEASLAAFEGRPLIYDPAGMAQAGVFVSLDAEGALWVERGFVRPEDETRASDPDDGSTRAPASDDTGGQVEPCAGRAAVTLGGQPVEPADEDDDAIRPLSDRLLAELSAHRTLALRDAVAGQPHVALTALLHKLVTDSFRHLRPSGDGLEVTVRHVVLPAQVAGLEDSPSARAIAARHEAWRADLPRDDEALWDWLAGLDEASRLALLAHCVSSGVNALVEKIDRYGGAGLSAAGLDRRLAQADRLAGAVGLDMVEAGWRPTVETYLGRVTKPRILDAVREARGAAAAQLIGHLKKADMAREAERLLDGTFWLPETLRRADAPQAGPDESSGQDLPAFLASAGGSGAEAIDVDASDHRLAAE